MVKMITAVQHVNILPGAGVQNLLVTAYCFPQNPFTSELSLTPNTLHIRTFYPSIEVFKRMNLCDGVVLVRYTGSTTSTVNPVKLTESLY